MAYTKTTWVNDAPPAINASNLNKIEQGIEDATDAADTANALVQSLAGTGTFLRSTGGTGSISLPNNTAKDLASITLTPGVWVVSGRVSYPSNSSGYRQIGISATSGSTSANVRVPAVSSATTALAYTFVINVTTTAPYYLVGLQTSGSTLSLTGSSQVIAAVLIK